MKSTLLFSIFNEVPVLARSLQNMTSRLNHPLSPVTTDTCQRWQIWAKIGPDWNQMGLNLDIFRSVFSTFCLVEKKSHWQKSEKVLDLSYVIPIWFNFGQNMTFLVLDCIWLWTAAVCSIFSLKTLSKFGWCQEHSVTYTHDLLSRQRIK